MVHRFLAAALGYSEPPRKSIPEVQKIADHCNDKKVAAKTVSEGSDETFFGLFVKVIFTDTLLLYPFRHVDPFLSAGL